MFDFSVKKFRYINFLLMAFILAATLLLIRNIINISFSKKGPYIKDDKILSNVVSNKKNIMHYSPVLEKNPFGRSMKLNPVSFSGRTKGEHVSLSDIVLIGTAVGPEDLSYAIFRDKSQSSSGRQEIFTFGETVFNNGVLKKINSSSVDLELDSVNYTLTISYEDMAADPEIPQVQSKGTSHRAFAKKISERQYLLDSRRVQQSLGNPEQILTDARLLPNFINGRQEGFKISEVKPDGLYSSLGLRNGDILLKINGLEISNPEVAIQAMSALKGMNRVNLDIVRNSKNMSMSYQIR